MSAVETHAELPGLRFLDVYGLRGRVLLSAAGERMGSISAVVRRTDGEVDLLVTEDDPRGRVTRRALDEVEIDALDRLWLRPAGGRVSTLVVGGAAASLTQLLTPHGGGLAA